MSSKGRLINVSSHIAISPTQPPATFQSDSTGTTKETETGSLYTESMRNVSHYGLLGDFCVISHQPPGRWQMAIPSGHHKFGTFLNQ
jgi:hypothetical protein